MAVTDLKIAVVNRQTKVSSSTVQDWSRAVGIQMSRDVAPTWGVTANIRYVSPSQTPPVGYWQVVILDNADMAGVLGYHDLTKAGLPLARVFVQTALAFGDLPSVVLSHEVLEMVGDPFVSLVVMDALDPLKFWPRELCDAVESDDSGYGIVLPATTTRPQRIIQVSDFVLPAYFNTLAEVAQLPGPFSFKHRVSGPVPNLANGGYMAFVRNGVWSQVSQFVSEANTDARIREKAKQRLDGPLDNRRVRRQIPRNQWIRSAVP
ncbi:MAG TPA: hypothetical protein VK531_12360 [Gemmatimonadales bacterium]|nr:hypothetical protein [Gemmatimonadales bacterium]